MKTAYLNVADRTGVVDFAYALKERGWELYSSGATLSALLRAEVSVQEAEISPAEMVELLGLNPDDAADMKRIDGIPCPRPDMVVCSLYPPEKIFAQKDFSWKELYKFADMWNGALLRAAARSCHNTIVLAGNADFRLVLQSLDDSGGLPERIRRYLAARALSACAYYDVELAHFLDESAGEEFPDKLLLPLSKIADLPYGENPHQSGAFYKTGAGVSRGTAAVSVVSGNPLRFNHYLDIDVAWAVAGGLDAPACAIVKHRNPCGVAVAQDPASAFMCAGKTDMQGSAWGVAAFNRRVDAACAAALGECYFECVVAPEFEDEAVKILRAKSDATLAVLPSTLAAPNQILLHSVSGGVLAETSDDGAEEKTSQVSRKKVSKQELRSLLFASSVAKYTRSYASVLVQGYCTVGIGSGQPSRLESLRLALRKAADNHPILDPSTPVVLASDTPLPPSCISEAAHKGISSIIQPGGSEKDTECIASCDKAGIAMLFTGVRHLKH